MGEWQPIETAPKDGTAVLAYIPWTWASGKEAAQCDVVAWYDASAFWYSPTAPNYKQACDTRCQPTHWMPLPSAPEPQS